MVDDVIDDTGRRRLADAVRTRRGQLDLAQDALSAHGGPGELTVRQIEHGQRVQYRERTLHQLDTALGWKDGIARQILRGDADPDPLQWEAPQEMRTADGQVLRSLPAGADPTSMLLPEDKSAGGLVRPGTPTVTRAGIALLDAAHKYFGKDPELEPLQKAVLRFVYHINGRSEADNGR